MCCFLMKLSVIQAALEEAHFEVFTNLWVNSSVIANATVHLNTECAIRCLKHSSCDLASVGYMENQTRKRCLMYESASFEYAPNLVSRPNWSILATDPCALTSCQNGATCRFTSGSLNYTCECPLTHFGQFCENACDISYGFSCVIVYPERKSWHDAVSTCTTMGGRIAEVPNANVSARMDKIADATGQDIWIGLTEQEPYFWVWITSQQNVTWSDWGSHQPDNNVHSNYCAHMWEWGSGWADRSCDDRVSYFCEFDINQLQIG